ncbi:MAG TPA: hypothetical protein VJ464_27960 [Blastocatellia bacterium]|nr:hypothetical protein [Blastocatellia bacterium]
MRPFGVEDHLDIVEFDGEKLRNVAEAADGENLLGPQRVELERGQNGGQLKLEILLRSEVQIELYARHLFGKELDVTVEGKTLAAVVVRHDLSRGNLQLLEGENSQQLAEAIRLIGLLGDG